MYCGGSQAELGEAFARAPSPAPLQGPTAIPPWARSFLQHTRIFRSQLSQNSFAGHPQPAGPPLGPHGSVLGSQEALMAQSGDIPAHHQQQMLYTLAQAEEIVSRLCLENLALQNRLSHALHHASSAVGVGLGFGSPYPSGAMASSPSNPSEPPAKRRKLTEFNGPECDGQADGGAELALVPAQVSYPAGYDPRRRRMSIWSESIAPSAEYHAVEVPKQQETKNRLCQIVSDNALFKHLTPPQLDEVVAAMICLTPAPGTIVMRHGESGDQMYIIESGEMEVELFGEIIDHLREGTTFGEQSLLYNCPRTATVIAKTQSVLWSIDRNTFRRIVMQESLKRRALWESFIAKVSFLEKLLPYERYKVADALEAIDYQVGDVIINQGDPGDSFFIIAQGTVECVKRDPENPASIPMFSMRLTVGEYFGELALLQDKPRQASVIAVDQVKLLSINKKHFNQVLGPVEDLLRSKINSYASYEQLVEQSRSTTNAAAASASGTNSQWTTPLSASGALRPPTVAAPLTTAQLLQSEILYMEQLLKVTNIYLRQLQSTPGLKIPQLEVEVLFSSFPRAVELHGALIEVLKSRPVSVQDGLEEPELDGSVLELLADILDSKVGAIQAHYFALEVIKRRSILPSFAHYLDMCTMEAGTSLDTLLYLPVKRINHYTPFVNLVQASRPNDFVEVVKRIRGSIQRLETVRTATEQVQTIRRNISGEFEWTTNPKRFLLYEGELVREDREIYHGFLFTDLLLLTKAISCGMGRFQATHYKSIYLNSCRLERVDNSRIQLNFTNPSGTADSIHLKLPSGAWLHHLTSALQPILAQANEEQFDQNPNAFHEQVPSCGVF